MADLNRLLLDNLALAFGVLAALVLLLLIGFVVQSARLGRAIRDLPRARAGQRRRHAPRPAGRQRRAGGERDRADERDRGDARPSSSGGSRRSLQHIGLVRFNPFEDTGSDQSFAIALLDDQRDGIVHQQPPRPREHARLRQAGRRWRLAAQPVRRGGAGHPDRRRGDPAGVTIGAIDPEQRHVARAARPAGPAPLPPRAAALRRPAHGRARHARREPRRSGGRRAGTVAARKLDLDEADLRRVIDDLVDAGQARPHRAPHPPRRRADRPGPRDGRAGRRAARGAPRRRGRAAAGRRHRRPAGHHADRDRPAPGPVSCARSRRGSTIRRRLVGAARRVEGWGARSRCALRTSSHQPAHAEAILAAAGQARARIGRRPGHARRDVR